MRYVQPAEWGFFPLDEELALLPGNLSPYIHENLVRLGAWMPFNEAAGLLEGILKVAASKSKTERCTEAAGAAYVAIQTEEADEIEREAPAAGKGGEKMVISSDGAMVPLLHGEWGEVRSMVIGEVAKSVLERGEWVVHSRNLSYFSRLVTAERFEHLTLSEVHRRGIENCQQVAAVMDGAVCLQSLVDYHCPKAVRILDFPHAGQRIGQVSEAIWGQGSAEEKQWTSLQLHGLKHQGPDDILVQLHTLQEQHPQLEVLRENLAYLEKRTNQMQYPQFQQQGWPIGSGIVESGNKLVVEVRLKGAGMHWKRENVDPMLALRNIICSDRWAQEWPKIEQRLRQQVTNRRKALREKHRRAAHPVETLHTETSLQATPAKIPPPEICTQTDNAIPPTQRTDPHRPALDHPWRHSPIGKARFQPSIPAKN
jgi:hypothetical protein